MVFHFDTNPVDFCLDTDIIYYGFCPDTSAYLETSLDNLGLSNTYDNLKTDPGNGLGITAPFKLKSRAERGAGGIDSNIDENSDTTLYYDLGINTAFDFIINRCADTCLGNKYSQALVKGHTQTTFS